MKTTKAAFERVIPNPKSKLLEQVREVCRLKHYSLRTEQSYVAWVRRFILFHQKRHPREMRAVEVNGFLGRLASGAGVAAVPSPGGRRSG